MINNIHPSFNVYKQNKVQKNPLKINIDQKTDNPITLTKNNNVSNNYQYLYFSATPSSCLAKLQFKKTVPCTNALITAWKDPKANFLIKKSIRGGNFKYTPALGEKFIVEIDKLCTIGYSCETIYSKLGEYFNKIKPQIESGFKTERNDRVIRRVNVVKELLGDFKPETMMDIGCGDGMMTEGIKEGLNLSKKNVTGLEVFVRPDADYDFMIKKFDGKHIPFKDNSQDLGLLFTVLHHVENPLEYLKEIHRTLKPGGHLIVREFDAKTRSDKLFNIMMDEMLYKVYTPYADVPLPNKYYGQKHWEKIFKNAGFEVKKVLKNEPDNPYDPFMTLLVKK